MHENIKSQLKTLGIKTGNFPPQEEGKITGIEEILPRIAKVEDRFFTNFWFSGQPTMNVVNDDRTVRIFSKNFRDAFTLSQAVDMDEALAATERAVQFENWVQTQTKAPVLGTVDYVI